MNLEELKAKYEDADRQISSYRTEPAEKMLFKPSKTGWSATEVCRHLIEFGKGYLHQMDQAVEHIRPTPQSDGPFRPRWRYRKMAAFFEPPYRLKVKTLPIFSPGDSQSVEQALEELSDIQQNVLYLIERAARDRWDLNRIRGRNPAFKMLSMSLIEFLVLMETHQRRHFWQIDQNFKRYEEAG